jgi:hypothetical protein
MIPQMTNEQFALWIASAKYSVSRDVVNIADKYYEWLESKQKKPGIPSTGITVSPIPDLTKPPIVYDGKTREPINK